MFGEHSMLPPPDVLARFKSKEEPASYPSGQDTSFKNLTPMPFRFTNDALPTVNERLAGTEGKIELPHYMTSNSEVGKLGLAETDLPMRWYGRSGMFTSSWVAEPKTRVSTGLNTSMEHSKCGHAPPLIPRVKSSSLEGLCSHRCSLRVAPFAVSITFRTRVGAGTWASLPLTWRISMPPPLSARSRAAWALDAMERSRYYVAKP